MEFKLLSVPQSLLWFCSCPNLVPYHTPLPAWYFVLQKHQAAPTVSCFLHSCLCLHYLFCQETDWGQSHFSRQAVDRATALEQRTEVCKGRVWTSTGCEAGWVRVYNSRWHLLKPRFLPTDISLYSTSIFWLVVCHKEYRMSHAQYTGTLIFKRKFIELCHPRI